MDGTHPPAGPVEGTLEHRPQLAVDRKTILTSHFVYGTPTPQLN